MKLNIIIQAIIVSIVLVPHIGVADGFSEAKSAPHGVIKYRLIDVKTNKTLSEQTLYLKNIKTVNRHIPSLSDKYFEDRYISICDDFIVGLNNYGYKDKNKVDGFGIWLKRSDKNTFSWEWYSQVNTNTFKKLQGNGQIKADFKQRGEFWEISKMSFIGDHKLRAKNKSVISEIKKRISNDPEDDWFCIILDGSYIIW